VIGAYRAFFLQPTSVKARVNMSRTGSNRGWGASQSDQVNTNANPDYKQVFDNGFEMPATTDDITHDSSVLSAVYAPNQWPDTPLDFQTVISAYYHHACLVAMDTLRAIAAVIGLQEDYFDEAFTCPMAMWHPLDHRRSFSREVTLLNVSERHMCICKRNNEV